MSDLNATSCKDKRNKVVGFRATNEEYMILKLISIFARLPISVVLRGMTFKWGATPGEYHRIYNAINRRELQKYMAFKRIELHRHAGERKEELWQGQKKVSEGV